MILIREVSWMQWRPNYSKLRSKACREKSAEVIVPCEDSAREGLNPTEVNIVKHHQMKGRKQKISAQNDSRPQKNRPEAKGYEGVQTFMCVEDGYFTTEQPKREYPLLEQILSPGNLNAAYKQVKSNGGAPGIDKMDCDRLLGYLREHGEQLTESIRRRTYRPNPVRRVEIPKDNGKTRQLGIPTVVDRVIQQAIAQVLTSIYERQFSEGSYGFRPRRGGKKALVKATEVISQGYHYAVDIDLERFFDTVNHSKLIETSQGGPLSPLLDNILFNEPDKELERRGHPFVRYADDCFIFCKSRRAAERVKEIDQWLRRRIRMCIWKTWKRPKTRVQNLIKCGIDK